MPQRLEKRKAELIEALAGRVRAELRKGDGGRKGGGKKGAELAERFVRRFYADVPPRDLAAESPEDLLGAARAVWRFAEVRKPGEPKVRAYVLGLNSPGLSIPFQLNHQLHVVQVTDRQEPQVQPYEAVAERVLEDYRQRNQQKLFAEVKAGMLRAEAFEFHPEILRRALSASVARVVASSLALATWK